MHPYLLPHLMTGCAKHRVKRTLLSRVSPASSLSRVPGVSGNLKKYTVATTFKPMLASTGFNTLYAATVGSDALTTLQMDRSASPLSGAFRLLFRSRYNNVNTDPFQFAHVTTRFLRDTTAWYLLVHAVDTTRASATATDNFEVYLNREMIPRAEWAVIGGVSMVSSANANTRMNEAGATHTISSPSHPFDGYIGETLIIDGAALTPDDFSKVDARSGNVSLKKFVGGYGGNSCYLPFAGDAGDAPATAAEGCKDRSGLGNNWTPANINVADFVKDSPTNFLAGSDYRGNFATLNQNDRRVGVGTLTNGGLTIASTTINPHRTRSTIPLPTSGKFIFSVELVAGASHLMSGLMRSDLSVNDASPNLGLRAGEVSYFGNGGEVYKDAALQGTFATVTTVGHHVVWAVDMSAGRAWVGKWDGAVLTWFGGGNPATGTSPTIAALPAGKLFPCVAPDSSTTLKAWFGAQGFPFTVPAGFQSLVVSALPKVPQVKAGTVVATATDTGTNIQSVLAAKRSGWSGYIEIFKRRDSAEGYRWRFSDDPGFYLDSSDAASGKLAFPALVAGGSYVGWALRVGAETGITTGVVNHVNGVADTIIDNSGTSRKVVILRRIDAPEGWYFYHPDLTAGRLLYLSTTGAEAVDSTITSVTANSWQISAGKASGTFRYIVLPEKAGAIAMGKWIGNGNVDGPSQFCGHLPALTFNKRIDAADGWYAYDDARNTINPRDKQLRLETNIAEVAATTLGDFLGSGLKVRSSSAGFNTAGAGYVYVSFAAAAFAAGECAAQGTAR